MAERGAGSVLSQDRSPPGGCALEAGGRRRRLPSRERLCFLSLFLFVVVCSSSFFHCVVSFVGMRRTPQGRLANSSQQQSTRSQLHSGGNGLRCCCCSLERLISTTPRTHSLGPYRRCAAGRRSCNLGWRVPARGPFDRPRPKAARLPTFNLPRADAGGRICCAAAFGFGGAGFRGRVHGEVRRGPSTRGARRAAGSQATGREPRPMQPQPFWPLAPGYRLDSPSGRALVGGRRRRRRSSSSQEAGKSARTALCQDWRAWPRRCHAAGSRGWPCVRGQGLSGPAHTPNQPQPPLPKASSRAAAF